MNYIAILLTSLGEAIIASLTIILIENTNFTKIMSIFIINFITSLIVFTLFDYLLNFKLYGTY
jgi:hypothetical protein